MISYVTFDQDGALTGAYLQAVPPEHAQCFIEVPDHIRVDWPSYRANSDRTGVERLASPDVDLAVLKKRLSASVDDAIALIYQRWMRFDREYAERESAARAFVAADYQGECGIWIAAFASAAQMEPSAAADLIIQQADTLHAALRDLGALRMRKYEILGAESVAAAEAARDNILTEAGQIEEGLN
jgi:hypothetical protein